jgi:hypothetical protein
MYPENPSFRNSILRLKPGFFEAMLYGKKIA